MLIRAVTGDGNVVADFVDEAETPAVGDVVWYQLSPETDACAYRVLQRAIDFESNRVALLVESTDVPLWMQNADLATLGSSRDFDQ